MQLDTHIGNFYLQRAVPVPNAGKGPGDGSDKEKHSLKNFKNNKKANEAAQQFGYETAEELKDDYVPGNGAKFNMKYDSVTHEIILERIQDTSVLIHTNLFLG